MNKIHVELYLDKIETYNIHSYINDRSTCTLFSHVSKILKKK